MEGGDKVEGAPCESDVDLVLLHEVEHELPHLLVLVLCTPHTPTEQAFSDGAKAQDARKSVVETEWLVQVDMRVRGVCVSPSLCPDPLESIAFPWLTRPVLSTR